MILLIKVILKLLDKLHRQLERSPEPESFIDSDIIAECIYSLRDVQEHQTALLSAKRRTKRLLALDKTIRNKE